MGRKLTERQQHYADAIIQAGLAERDEVERAFRERTPENEVKITSWGNALTRKRKEDREAALRRLQTREQCAYPGCSNVIEVKRTWSDDPGTPRPTRTLTLTVQLEGWHWVGLSKVENTRTTTVRLWACPEHQQDLFRLDFTLTPTIGAREDPPIRYPMASETEWKVYELARGTGQMMVEQAQSVADLPRIRRTIQPLAEREVDTLIAGSDPATLTDDLEKFRKLYIEQFIEGFLEGLRARKLRRG